MLFQRFALLVALLTVTSTCKAITVIELPLWDNAPELSADAIGTYENRKGNQSPNRWLHSVEHPVVTLYRPAPDKTTGAAVVIFPGGGYSGTAIDKEGHFVGAWLAERGAAALVVPYRCGGGPHQHPVPLSDAQRAIRLVRKHASDWAVDPAKVGVLGFSAGGHLAASATTMFNDTLPHVEDSLQEISARPDFSVLIYPVISMRKGIGHNGSRKRLIGNHPTEELLASMSPDERVGPDTPPTLLIHSADDQSVSVENSLRFFQACQQHGVASELHVYPIGGHGYGMWAEKGTVAEWPAVLENWLAEQDCISK